MRKSLKSILMMVLILSLALNLAACGNDEADENKDDTNEAAEVAETDSEEESDDDHDEHSHDAPFEWRGTYNFAEGTYTLKFADNSDEIDGFAIGFIRTDADIDDVEHHAAHMMDEDAHMDHIHLGEEFEAKHEYGYDFHLEGESGEITFTIEEGEFYIFMEHLPEEVKLEILNEDGEALEATDIEIFEEGTEV